MKWESTPQTILLAEQLQDLLPKNFDYKTYIDLYPDLLAAGIDNYQKAKEHYLFFGRREGRIYAAPDAISVLQDSSYELWNNSATHKNIMVFSPAAPDYDKSSGGNRLYQILKILKNTLKYNVYFFCNDPVAPKYIESVEKLGIQTFQPNLKENIYMNVYIEKLKAAGVEFDNAMFCWYDMGAQYINIVKKYYPEIKIIVDSVDVHWIREQRGYDSGELSTTVGSLKTRKNLEKQIYKMANVVFAITKADKSHIENEIGFNTNVKVLSNIHYPQNITLGNNLFFIGNYAHYPNIQGAIESINVFDSFCKTKTYKQLKTKPKLFIVGPNITNRITSKIKNKNIVVLGQIEQLDTLYKECCLNISPLYWGGGIKGKICDSGMAGMPILTTDIGNEGIGLVNKESVLLANSQEDFINQLVYFFGLSKKKQQQLGISAKQHLSNIVGFDAAVSCLKSTLEDKHIVISIITYNQTEKLKKCLQSIFEKTKYSKYTIVISDNSNNPKIYKIINSFKKTYPEKIKYIKNKTNEYFIAPNNKVINDSLYADSDIVLLNDDIEILSDGWLNYLYSTAYSSNDIGAVGGKTLYPDNTIAEAGAELYNDGSGKNLHRYKDCNNPEANIRKCVGYCSGCLLYMRRDAINKIGVLDTRLEKMYYEDSEWQYRAHLNGLKTIYEPRCIAIHHEGSSSGININAGSKRYQEINRTIFNKIYKDIDIEKLNGCF